jgi:hypothetical protein
MAEIPLSFRTVNYMMKTSKVSIIFSRGNFTLRRAGNLAENVDRISGKHGRSQSIFLGSGLPDENCRKFLSDSRAYDCRIFRVENMRELVEDVAKTRFFFDQWNT